MKTLETCGRTKTLAGADLIASTGYVGTNALTPARKQAGCERTDADKNLNHVIVGVRSVIGRLIAHWKNWKIGRWATAGNSTITRNHPPHHPPRTLPARLVAKLGISF